MNLININISLVMPRNRTDTIATIDTIADTAAFQQRSKRYDRHFVLAVIRLL